MINLYSELNNLLSAHKKTIDDIERVECNHFSENEESTKMMSISIDCFIDSAKNTNYDDESYLHPLPSGLKIYGKNRDFLIRVSEYDGKMWLEYIDMEIKAPEIAWEPSSFALSVEHPFGRSL